MAVDYNFFHIVVQNKHQMTVGYNLDTIEACTTSPDDTTIDNAQGGKMIVEYDLDKVEASTTSPDDKTVNKPMGGKMTEIDDDLKIKIQEGASDPVPTAPKGVILEHTADATAHTRSDTLAVVVDTDQTNLLGSPQTSTEYPGLCVGFFAASETDSKNVMAVCTMQGETCPATFNPSSCTLLKPVKTELTMAAVATLW